MKKQSWPAWYFGPDGARAVFERAEDVPEGWQDHPPKAEDADGADDGAEDSTEAAMIERLTEFHLADERRILPPDDDFPNGRDVIDMATGYMVKLEVENAELHAKADASAEEAAALRAKVEALEAEKADLKAAIAKFDHDGDGAPGGKAQKSGAGKGKSGGDSK